MKVNDLVKYRKYPHFELHATGMTGLVIESPSLSEANGEEMAPVMWSQMRLPPAPGNVKWEYIEDLEVIDA